jgi:hypothetical protein
MGSTVFQLLRLLDFTKEPNLIREVEQGIGHPALVA